MQSKSELSMKLYKLDYERRSGHDRRANVERRLGAVCEMPKKDKFAELTEEVSQKFYDKPKKGSSWERINCEKEKGVAYIRTVRQNSDIALSENYAAKGTTFPKHQHKGIEVFIIKKGSMKLFVEGKTGQYDEFVIDESRPLFVFNAEKAHYAVFDEETEYEAIIRPSNFEWPAVSDGQRRA